MAEDRAWNQRHLATLVGSRPANKADDAKGLTEREREVLRGVFDGLAKKEIAAQLQSSERAVKAVLATVVSQDGRTH